MSASKNFNQKTLDSFVDDRKLWILVPNNNVIASRIKHCVEFFQQLLVFTGGGLNLKKCKWMIVNEKRDEVQQ